MIFFESPTKEKFQLFDEATSLGLTTLSHVPRSQPPLIRALRVRENNENERGNFGSDGPRTDLEPTDATGPL